MVPVVVISVSGQMLDNRAADRPPSPRERERESLIRCLCLRLPSSFVRLLGLRATFRSLSPEQQAFAKAFRAMQLESTLFGVLVVQIKPQLERVLNLADDSLTKEIKLTQDLMQLFIKQLDRKLISGSRSGQVKTYLK